MDNSSTVLRMSPSPNPNPTKTTRVSAGNHARLTALAERLNGTVDDAVNWLFTRDNLVRVPVSEDQRERWEVQANITGLPLEQFIAACTESAVMNGLDRGSMVLMSRNMVDVRNMVGEIHRLLRDNIPQ